MKKNVSTTLMTATLATVIGLGGAAIVNPTQVYAMSEVTEISWQDYVTPTTQAKFDNAKTPAERNKIRRRIIEKKNELLASGYEWDIKAANQIPAKYLTLEDENAPAKPEKPVEVDTPKVDVVVPEKDIDTPAEEVKPEAEVVAPEKDADVDVKDEAVDTEDKTDVDQPEAEVVAPEKDTETPAEDNAPAEVETPKVDDAEKPAVVPEVDTEVKTEEKKDTSDQPNTDTKPAEKVVDSKTSNEPKHMKKSATPETADVTAGIAAYLVGGLGLGLVSRKKK